MNDYRITYTTEAGDSFDSIITERTEAAARKFFTSMNKGLGFTVTNIELPEFFLQLLDLGFQALGLTFGALGPALHAGRSSRTQLSSTGTTPEPPSIVGTCWAGWRLCRVLLSILEAPLEGGGEVALRAQLLDHLPDGRQRVPFLLLGGAGVLMVKLNVGVEIKRFEDSKKYFAIFHF